MKTSHFIIASSERDALDTLAIFLHDPGAPFPVFASELEAREELAHRIEDAGAEPGFYPARWNPQVWEADASIPLTARPCST